MATIKRKRKRHTPIKISFGFIIFALVLLYMLIRIFASMKDEEIITYQVLKTDYDAGFSETGLIVRNETVGYSDTAGYICYYIKDGEKVSKGGNVYSVDGTGSMSEALEDATYDSSLMLSSKYSDIGSQIEIFKSQVSASDFYEVYNFKYSLENEVLEVYNEMVLDTLSTSSDFSNTFKAVTAPDSGVVTYYLDGFEDYDVAQISPDDFKKDEYSKESLKSTDIVTSGSPIYKLVDSEAWKIAVEVTEDEYNRLTEKDTIKFNINDSQKVFSASYSAVEQNGGYFVILNMNKYMVDYISERYVSISFIFSEISGLQIPNSSVTEKTVYMIPLRFLTKGSGTDDEKYFNQRVLDENGDISGNLVSPTIYYTDDIYCYVDSDEVDSDAVFVANDTNETLSVSTATTMQLQGVYCTTKGITTFKRINILVKGDDYSLVEDELSNGISAYDWIVQDASTVTENQFVY